MDRAEFLDDRELLLYALLEPFLKVMQLALLLVKVLDQSPSALLHLIQSPLQTYPIWSGVPLTMFNLLLSHSVL